MKVKIRKRVESLVSFWMLKRLSTNLPMHATTLSLKEPCLWSQHQILQWNMYDSTCLFQSPHYLSLQQIHISTQTETPLETPQWHRRHMWENTKAVFHTNTLTRGVWGEGGPDDLLTVQYLHWRASGVSGVRSCMRNSAALQPLCCS